MTPRRREPPIKREANPSAGQWRISRGHRNYYTLAAGAARWILYRSRPSYTARSRTLAYMGKEEAIELLRVWGFSSDEIWRADNFCPRKSVTTPGNSLKLHTSTLAPNLIPPRRALAPFNLGG